ncbi:hypothetical protein CHS0354_040194 [Potamilus streckersoni]|uniref:Uncharacterized protein n=1 Tax=Potamilus streckersoni TaxID=2493646 RepID=A0AAE0SG54_9BIVA|nr:hypothetical protein CHS0354_040194 [Potamilus streckersoni]
MTIILENAHNQSIISSKICILLRSNQLVSRASVLDEEQSSMSLFEPLIVAAIDIGTTYSGYAFSTRDEFENDPLKMYVNLNWISNSNFFGEKTATAVLFDEHKNFRNFGFKAEEDYADLNDEQMKKWYFFSRFKMNLYQRRVRY